VYPPCLPLREVSLRFVNFGGVVASSRDFLLAPGGMVNATGAEAACVPVVNKKGHMTAGREQLDVAERPF